MNSPSFGAKQVVALLGMGFLVFSLIFCATANGSQSQACLIVLFFLAGVLFVFIAALLPVTYRPTHTTSSSSHSVNQSSYFDTSGSLDKLAQLNQENSAKEMQVLQQNREKEAKEWHDSARREAESNYLNGSNVPTTDVRWSGLKDQYAFREQEAKDRKAYWEADKKYWDDRNNKK